MKRNLTIAALCAPMVLMAIIAFNAFSTTSNPTGRPMADPKWTVCYSAGPARPGMILNTNRPTVFRPREKR